jgi:hypothetical protein
MIAGCPAGAGRQKGWWGFLWGEKKLSVFESKIISGSRK